MLLKKAIHQAYQNTLFSNDEKHQLAISKDSEYQFKFYPTAYAPSKDYDGRFGWFDFRHHYYGRIGDFDNSKEFAGACRLEQQAQYGKIEFWVRNLVRKEDNSFFLQKGDVRFYSDFICQLPNGRILVGEYKGANQSDNAKDKRFDWIEQYLK